MDSTVFSCITCTEYYPKTLGEGQLGWKPMKPLLYFWEETNRETIVSKSRQNLWPEMSQRPQCPQTNHVALMLPSNKVHVKQKRSTARFYCCCMWKCILYTREGREMKAPCFTRACCSHVRWVTVAKTAAVRQTQKHTRWIPAVQFCMLWRQLKGITPPKELLKPYSGTEKGLSLRTHGK